MNELTVKSVDVLGDAIMATKDADGQIWAGVSYFCNALGMSRVQKDTQVDKIREDKALSKGYRKFPVGVFDQNNEAVGIRLDFVPIWLAKITITKRMQKDHPELADKLLEYQLKAKDILAAAFLPKQADFPRTTQAQIQLLAQGNVELNQRVDKVTEEVQTVKQQFEDFKETLPLLPEDADEVKNALNKRVVEFLGGKDGNSYHNKSLCQKVFADAYRSLKYNFNVGSYKSIKRNQKAQALQIIEEYKPPLFLAEQIVNVNAQQSLDLEGGAAK